MLVTRETYFFLRRYALVKDCPPLYANTTATFVMLPLIASLPIIAGHVTVYIHSICRPDISNLNIACKGIVFPIGRSPFLRAVRC